tara:strand:- start:259 stop:441 length:183 start_codon:yes stop_codon:yes gene_type:complete
MTTHTLPNMRHTPSVQAIGKHQRKIADDERASQSIYRRRVDIDRWHDARRLDNELEEMEL